MNQKKNHDGGESGSARPISDASGSDGQKQGGKVDTERDISENKPWALLAYLGILCLVPLLAKRDSSFAQFHAKQGLVLLIGWVVSWIPVFGWIVWVGVVVLSIIGIINVLSGEMKPLPLVGDVAKNLSV